METNLSRINELLSTVYTDIMRVEESELHKSQFNDLSLKEVHAIDAITMYDHKTSSQLAKDLMVTAGTITSMVNKLVHKGYVVRMHGVGDRRLVLLGLTNRGRLVYRAHDSFHRHMVEKFIDGFDNEQIAIIERALLNLRAFLEFPAHIDNTKQED